MFSKALLVNALAACAAAQSTVLFFTKVPNPVIDGQPQAVTFATNDTATPVSIILRQGPSGNLQTVTTLTSDASNGQYIWTPPMGLPNGVDYALQITQGTQSNYFGPFAIQGASTSASAYPSSVSASASAYPSSASSISLTTSVSASANTTMSTTAVVPIGTVGTVGTIGSMSAGTGTALPRNTTMSMATLTASTTAMTTTATATDSGAGFQGSQTSSDSSASATGASSATINVGSSIALFGAFAAALFMQ